MGVRGGSAFGIRQVYRVDRAAGDAATILLVSRDNDGNPATAHCDNPSISDDGDVVVFSTAALLSEDDFGQSPARIDVYARILSVPATRLLSIPRDQTGQPLEQGDGDSMEPCVSGDGSFAAFSSKATNLIPDDANGPRQDILRVTTDGVGTPELVSVDNSGPQGTQSLETDFSTAGATSQGVGSCIDRTGSRVLFHGTPCDWSDTLLCPAPGNNCGACLEGALQAFQQVYLRDLGSGTSGGAQATGGDSSNADVTADGRVAVYESSATNLNPGGDGNGLTDIYETLSPQGPFIRGDANDENGAVDLSDAEFILKFLFEGGDVPPCLDAADADDSGVVNLTDANYVLNFLFRGGPPPPPPYPGCGNDPTGDPLTSADQSCP